MDYTELKLHFKNSPALRLLRSDYAAEVLAFLHDAFKRNHQLAIRSDDFAAQLQVFIDTEVHSREGDVPSDRRAFPEPAQRYLERWCSDEVGWLRRFFDDRSDEPLFELSAEAELVLRWIDDLRPRAVVGTESRFRSIFRLLGEILEYSTADLPTRVTELERRRDEITRQIEAILATGSVEMFSAGQIKERFVEAVRNARQLLGDFRAVEQNFRLITQELQERQLDASRTRGEMVEFVLDRGAALEESEQGQSFYAFFRHLLSEESQRELRELIRDVQLVPELRSEVGDGQTLKHLLTWLVQESQKVIRTNHRLAEQLRRALDRQNLAERKRVHELIKEIKALGQKLRGDLAPGEPCITVDHKPAIDSPMERPLWQPRHEIHLAGAITDHIEKPHDGLVAQFGLLSFDLPQLRRNVEEALRTREQVTLSDLLAIYPPHDGVFDLLGYVAVATESGYLIDSDSIATFPLAAREPGGSRRIVRFPEVYFVRKT